MLYRAQDAAGASTIGYATSKDGIHFVRWPRPVLTGGRLRKERRCRSPRLVRIDDSFYLTYTGYNRVDAQLCLAKSDDLQHWTRFRHHTFPRIGGGGMCIGRNLARFWAQKIIGHYWMYFMGNAAGDDGPSDAELLILMTCSIGLSHGPSYSGASRGPLRLKSG